MISYQKLAISVAVVVAVLVPVFFVYAIFHILDSIRLSEYLKKNKPERWRALNPAKKRYVWGSSIYPTLDLDILRSYLKSDEDNDDPGIKKLKRAIQWFSRKHVIALAITLVIEALFTLILWQYYSWGVKGVRG